MITDIWTMMWKEWKELLVQRGSLRGGALTLLIAIGFLGVVPPLQTGSDWLASPVALILSGWAPFVLVSSVIADSFAGERERHTLETLLTTRLSDRAILFGKVCAAISYGWGLALIILLLELVTVNLAFGHGSLLMYPATIGLSSVGLALLGAGLAAGAGILVSLRAPTVRYAQQILSAAGMLLLLIPLYGAQALPVDWTKGWAELSVTRIVLLAMAVLSVLDAGLLVAAMARFKRAELILD